VRRLPQLAPLRRQWPTRHLLRPPSGLIAAQLHFLLRRALWLTAASQRLACEADGDVPPVWSDACERLRELLTATAEVLETALPLTATPAVERPWIDQVHQLENRLRRAAAFLLAAREATICYVEIAPDSPVCASPGASGDDIPRWERAVLPTASCYANG
jgi:hypothetical protein